MKKKNIYVAPQSKMFITLPAVTLLAGSPQGGNSNDRSDDDTDGGTGAKPGGIFIGFGEEDEQQQNLWDTEEN